MTTTTRRAALMGALALPVAASAAALPAIAEAAEPDPIFAAIEAHKAAWKAFGDAIDDMSAAEKQYAARYGTWRPSVVLVTRAEWNNAIQEWPYGDADAKRLSSAEEIDRYTAGPSGKRSKLRQRLRKELAEARRAHRREVGPLERVWHAANEADNQARAALVRTEPTTISGIVAVLTYIREHEDSSEFLSDDGSWEFLVSIEMALREIAGMEEVETEAA